MPIISAFLLCSIISAIKSTLEEKIATHRQQTSQLNTQVIELQQELVEVKQNALSDARQTLQNELHGKDIEIRERDAQILNCKGTIEGLKRKLSGTQPERKGEAGEQDLLEDLREAFPEDQFSRQTRGISVRKKIFYIFIPNIWT